MCAERAKCVSPLSEVSYDEKLCAWNKKKKKYKSGSERALYILILFYFFMYRFYQNMDMEVPISSPPKFLNSIDVDNLLLSSEVYSAGFFFCFFFNNLC